MAYQLLKPQPLQRIRGVLLDMDGLVLDTEKLYTRFWMEAAQALGYPMTLQQALGMRSLNRVHGLAYLERCFGPGVDYTAMRAERIRRMDAWILQHGVEPKPGIEPFLAYLHAEHIPCAITTSSPQERIKAYLKPLGLYDLFDAFCSGYEVAHGKPDPDIYLYGAHCLSLTPESCLALEDSPSGLLSAHRAGCLPVVIPDRDEPDDDALSLCFARADRPDDLIPLLESMIR